MKKCLWIGSGDGTGCNCVAEAPQLEITWVQDLHGAIDLPLRSFHFLVLDETSLDRAKAALEKLRTMKNLPPIAARIHNREYPHRKTLLECGANSVLIRPASILEAREQILQFVSTALPSENEPSPPDSNPPGILGDSLAMQEVFRFLHKAQRSEASVLLHGETGTGKEAIASAIHSGSRRAEKRFLSVNCAAMTDTLLESELFGHVRGAFTGAGQNKKGLFEAADEGTLFLDEIAETSPLFQAKLLRVLQEGEVRPVGSTETRHVDVRIITATHRNLEDEVEAGNFREDLFYRLAVFPINIPPLRNRTQDIEILSRHFLRVYGEKEGKPGCQLSIEALHDLEIYPWPGNVRELENEMHRLIALASPHECINSDQISSRIRRGIAPTAQLDDGPGSLRIELDRIEAWLILRALEKNQMNRTRTAESLGITREGLYKKLKRLKIDF